MDDFRSLIIGVVGGFIVIAIAKGYRLYRRKSIKDDIEYLEFEKSRIEVMSKSGVKMNMHSFRSIFALFLIFGLANLIPKCFELIAASNFSNLSLLSSIVIWATFVGLSLRFVKRYDRLENRKEACEKLDEKISKLNCKLPNN